MLDMLVILVVLLYILTSFLNDFDKKQILLYEMEEN